MIAVPQNATGGGLGALVEIDREAFLRLLKKMEEPLVLHVHGGLPKQHKYLVQYQGYLFTLKAKEPHDFTREAEVIHAKKIHLNQPATRL